MNTANSSSSILSTIINAVQSAVSTIANAVQSVIAPPQSSTSSTHAQMNAGENQTIGILFPLGKKFSITRMLNETSATLFSEEIMTIVEEVTINGETVTQEAEITALFTYSGSESTANGRLSLVDVQLTSINTGDSTIPITSNLVNLGQFPHQFRFNLGTGATFEVIIETIIPFDVQVSTPQN